MVSLLAGLVLHVFVASTVAFMIFGLFVGVSVGDHSLLGHLLDDVQEVHFLVSLLRGGLPFVFEGVAHLLGGVVHVLVSLLLGLGLSHNLLFGEDALVHVVDMVSHLSGEVLKFSQGLVKGCGNTVIFLLLFGFNIGDGVKVDSDVTDDFLHKSLDFLN